MLRLEKLEISGFKSFPDKTRVEFPDGVTAVVGPNGCGKSNVVDAVQWALGEQSAKALRGGRMEDVIFAGSKDRGPGGLAEVTLHLVAANGEEILTGGRKRVSMTRRLFRSGESEYLLDGKKARLVDIRGILDHIRAGVRTYAIIDQSRVGSFVVSKPRERRVFIEEAAGISGYKQQRRRAELKLEATQANLLRVEDIVREVERQRRSLQRQASLARRARRLNDEYFGLKTVWLARRWKELSRTVHDLEEILGVRQREAAHLEAERRRVEAGLERARFALDDATREREQSVERMHEAELALERLQAEIVSARDRSEALEAEAGRREGETRELAEDRQARESEIGQREQDLSLLAEGVATAEANVVAARERAGEARTLYHEDRERAGALEREVYEHLHKRAELSAEHSAAREAAAREERRAKESEEAGARIRESLGEARAAEESARATLEEAGRRADELARAVSEAREAEERASAGLEEARGEEGRVAAELGARAGEKSALDSLEVRLAGAEGAREVLERAQRGELEARLVVADVLEADADVERAAEAFLADLLPAVVVERSDEVLRGASLGLKGRLHFLPLDAPGSAQGGGAGELPDELAGDPRVVGRLAARLRVRGSLNGALMSRVRDAIVVDTLQTALELHRRFPAFSFVSREGHAVRSEGLVTLEGPTRGAEEDGLLARTRRRDELQTAVDELEASRARAKGDVEAAREALSAAQAARREAEETLGEARRKVATARVALEQSEREVGRFERESAQARHAHQVAEQGLAEARERSARCTEQVAEQDRELQVIRGQLEEARRAARTREEALGEANTALALVESEMRALGERHSALGREVERMRRELNELEQRRARGQEARREAIEEAQRLAERARELERQLDDARSRVEKSRHEQLALGTRVEERSREVHELEKRAHVVGEELESARARREQTALQAERNASDLEHLRESCVEELSKEPAELSTEPTEGLDHEVLASEALLNERLADLRKKRARLGPVNLLAEQEFDELSERWEELTAQRDDLVESVRELQSSIARMNRESKERFLEAFNEIRRHFREQFAILFRGGRADVKLEDEDDPLESGIEILCQPPGKKLQAATLLSGGEKSLAATAMLFAIFRYHPPPFCLLDEVDAPLDDANVGRFAEALRTFCADTQFIVVTHNKRTMELADLLYGVTMPEPGVSRLVSMTLD